MPRFVSILLTLSYCLLCFPTILAAPTSASHFLVNRQDNTPVTVVTENTVQGPSGPVTETCTITLTPITVDGQSDFLEQKSCEQAPASSNNNNTPPATPTDNTSNTDSTTDTSTQQVASPTDTSSSIDATPTDSTTLDTQPTSSAVASSNPVSPTDVSVIGASLATALSSVTQTDAATSTQAGIVSSTDSTVAAAPTDVTVLGPSSMPTASAVAILATPTISSSPSPTASAASNFAIPGKSIQVLPIGLGIFAGVSVIALIVVGLVTYERTKYRRKFRKDKLAEAAAPMGYGGMAERI